MWQIAAATGWSVDRILHRINYQTLVMMLSDAPRYVGGKGEGRTSRNKPAEAEAGDIANFFASNLKA